jgi:ribosomal protein L12E/L44/L45/RPP1/RPP2
LNSNGHTTPHHTCCSPTSAFFHCGRKKERKEKKRKEKKRKEKKEEQERESLMFVVVAHQ